jgi:uracil-DNA glycosylase family 4
MQHSNHTATDLYIQALKWHLDQGIDVALSDKAVSFYNLPEQISSPAEAPPPTSQTQTTIQPAPQPTSALTQQNEQVLITEATKLAMAANTLEELQNAISEFDGLTIKRTASNMVFSDGNPKAKIMLIGEAPGADEDRQGKPFTGKSGQLLDQIFSFIELSRHNEDIASSLYMSNILNWRPPGNRTPDAHEISASVPFIERHIALVNPDILLFAGNVVCKTLLNSKASIMRLRGKWQSYTPLTPNIANGTEMRQDKEIKTLPILHPAYILQNPSDKAKMWIDMLTLHAKLSA